MTIISTPHILVDKNNCPGYIKKIFSKAISGHRQARKYKTKLKIYQHIM